MGLKALLVDRLPRLGDLWRSRYETVRSHTPIYTDHYSFLKYPETWPRWVEQEKISNWMEHYGEIMGLDYMLGTAVKNIDYDEKSRLYTVQVENAQGVQTFRVPHLVLAAGLFSPTPVIPDIPGKDTFQGQVYHSKFHKAARLIPDISSKEVVIVGCGTSAHDVAQDFVNNGAASVSIVQRHPIFSFTTKSMETTFFSLWQTPGWTLEEADIISNSFPLPVARTMNIPATAMMEELDKETIQGMEKAGMRFKKTKDCGHGFLDQLMIKAGHFYADQGAAAMIVDGRIKIHNCEQGVTEFIKDGVVLGSGEKVHADVVVMATGYQRSKSIVKDIMGKEVAAKLGDIGHLDKEQERIGVSCCLSFDFNHIPLCSNSPPTDLLFLPSGGDPPDSQDCGI
jgi:cation diffusion facilitator CzcD-associated flavoprotein CzcO